MRFAVPAAGFTARPIYRPRDKRLPHPGSLVVRTLRCWSTRPPVSRQALVFPDLSLIAIRLDLNRLFNFSLAVIYSYTQPHIFFNIELFLRC